MTMKQEPPFLSIIIPTRARPRHLKSCFRALTNLDYPRSRFEVLVVNDGGPEPCRDILDTFRGELDLTLLTQPHSGPAAARNHGAGKAKGEFLAFTDDDCEPAADWLKNLAERLRHSPDHAIGGKTLNGLPENPYSEASQMLTDYLYARYDADPEQASFFCSNNMACSSKLFHAMGGFNPAFPLPAGEDREWCGRWRAQGLGMTYAGEARVHHSHPLNFKSFVRLHFRYGRGAFLYHRLRADRHPNRRFPEPFSFYWRLIVYPFSRFPKRRAFAVARLLLLSQGTNALGYLWEWIHCAVKALPLK